MHTRNFTGIFLTAPILIFAVFCASSPINPADPVSALPGISAIEKNRDTESNRFIWAYYRIEIDTDGGKIEAVPARDALGHWNVLKFLEQGPCSNCVKIANMQPSGNGTLLVDIEVKHPFADPTFTGFDVRGICMFTGTHDFPAAGFNLSDRTKGEGELVNPDGFTTLYNYTTQGKGPGGLQGYQKGKFAGNKSPIVTLSGFKRFVSSDVSNNRNAFYSGDDLTETYEIDLADNPGGFGYAVDACWVQPTNKPVTDPMTDFPPNANCPEPWKITVTETPVGQGLTDQGGQTILHADVYDWQGKDSHALPMFECPELFDGKIEGSWVSDGVGFSKYEVTVSNSKLASAGVYKCLVSVEDNENASSPDWLNLTAYFIYPLNVNNVKPDHHELWYYHGVNLLPDDNLTAAIELLSKAKAAGYEKVVLADFKLGTIDIQSETYWNHLQTYSEAAKDIGIEVIPSLVPIGYSDAVLCHDPNLIEGQPVKDCAFRVNGTTASVEKDITTGIVNGNFENHNGDAFPGWIQMDGIGVETFADTSIKHTGSCSIRFENFTSQPSGNDRIRQQLTVKPWNCYAVSFWVRTENTVPSSEINATIFSEDFSKTLEFLSYDINETQDWTHYYMIFNSQDEYSVHIYMGIWGGESGKFWLDDVSIENAGLINLIRREGAPFKVTNETGSVTYTEGVDYEYVEDPLMGNAGSYTGTFDLYHTAPTINILPGSKIKNGDKILVDYYHCTFVYDLQTACCLTDNAVFDIFNSTLSKVNELINPTEVFIAVDELRVVNWCDSCQSTGKTPGELLSDATERVDQIAHNINPQWKLITWSDMYDPNHNAHDEYYLANGTLENSWDGLPANWDIGNWLRMSEPTLAFFDDRGNRQILCGYYDESGPDFSIDDWLDLSKPYGGVYAVMYTTWWKGYDDMESWAQVVKDWDEANW